MKDTNKENTFIKIPDLMKQYEEFRQNDILVYSVIYEYCIGLKHIQYRKDEEDDFGLIEDNNDFGIKEETKEDDTLFTYVSNNEIALRATLCESTAAKSVGILNEAGVINIKRGKSGKRKITIVVDFFTGKCLEDGENNLHKKEKYRNKRYKKTFYKVPDKLLNSVGIKISDAIVYSVLHNFMQLKNPSAVNLCGATGKFKVETIAERANCCVSTVNNSLANLKKKKIIKAKMTQDRREFTILKDYLGE